jgi:hypothetical protein
MATTEQAPAGREDELRAVIDAVEYALAEPMVHPDSLRGFFEEDEENPMTEDERIRGFIGTATELYIADNAEDETVPPEGEEPWFGRLLTLWEISHPEFHDWLQSEREGAGASTETLAEYYQDLAGPPSFHAGPLEELTEKLIDEVVAVLGQQSQFLHAFRARMKGK